MFECDKIQKFESFYVVENFLSVDEVDMIRNHWHTLEWGPQKITWGREDPKITPISTKFRICNVWGIPTNKFEFLEQKSSEVFNCLYEEGFKFYDKFAVHEYPLGGHHVRHFDHLSDDNTHRDLIISVQLSDENEYEGGELLVSDNSTPQKKGSAIIYKSMDFHIVKEVTKGKRYSITICGGPK